MTSNREPIVLAAPVRTPIGKFGGALAPIALGHPIGCTGARIVVSLLNGLEARDACLGIATLCVSGGMGLAALIERL